MKRAASKSAGSTHKKRARKMPIVGQVKTIASAIKAADALPKPVRSIISDRLIHVFGTYKEDRHKLQSTVSDLVGTTLKAQEASLKAAIAEAEAHKQAADSEGASLTAASTAAAAVSEEKAKAAEDGKAALTACIADLTSSKAAQHDAEEAVKTLDMETMKTVAKKEKLEALVKEFFTPVKEGTLDKGLTKSASWAGKQLEKDHILEKEFLVCVIRTFSKARVDWKTFDHIVDKELAGKVSEVLATLLSELGTMAGQKDPTAASVISAKAAVAAAEEKVKAAEDTLVNLTNEAKDAKVAAKGAADAMKAQEKSIHKSASILESANDALVSFQEGPLASYTEAEAHTAPPPPAEEPPVEDVAGTLEEAMTAAPPAAATQSSPSILPSPGIMASRALAATGSALSSVGAMLAPSPRIASSPRL
jgi:hypothetical protein